MKTRLVQLIAVVLMGSLVDQGFLRLSASELLPKKFKKSKLTHQTSEQKADHRSLLLAAGESKTLDLNFEIPKGDAFIQDSGDGKVVKITPVNFGQGTRQLLIAPLKAGDCNVLVRDETGVIKLVLDIRVAPSNLLERASELRDLLRDVEGIDLRVVGKKIVVDGEVLVINDLARLSQVLADDTFKDLILNLTTLSPLGMQSIAKKIEGDVSTFAPNVKVRVINGIFIVEGTVDSDESGKRIIDTVSIYLPEVKPVPTLTEAAKNVQVALGRQPYKVFLKIAKAPEKKQEKLIRLTYHFVELNKDYQKVFGFKWQPGFTADPQIQLGQNAAGQAAAGGGSSFSATIGHLFPRLESAQSAGYAKIIKSGSIITRSGQKATYSSQIDIPIVMMGDKGQQQAGNASVGTEVTITPRIVGSSDDIMMDVSVKESALAGRAPAGSTPLISRHNVTSNIYVKNAESAALLGLSQNAVTTSFNRDDPDQTKASGEDGSQALFSLLRSKGYSKKKMQAVMFITPQIIENANEGSEDLKKNFRIKVK